MDGRGARAGGAAAALVVVVADHDDDRAGATPVLSEDKRERCAGTARGTRALHRVIRSARARRGRAGDAGARAAARTPAVWRDGILRGAGRGPATLPDNIHGTRLEWTDARQALALGVPVPVARFRVARRGSAARGSAARRSARGRAQAAATSRCISGIRRARAAGRRLLRRSV